MFSKDIYVVIRFWEPRKRLYSLFPRAKNNMAHVSLEIVRDNESVYISYLHKKRSKGDIESAECEESNYDIDSQNFDGPATSKFYLYGLDCRKMLEKYNSQKSNFLSSDDNDKNFANFIMDILERGGLKKPGGYCSSSYDLSGIVIAIKNKVKKIKEQETARHPITKTFDAEKEAPKKPAEPEDSSQSTDSSSQDSDSETDRLQANNILKTQIADLAEVILQALDKIKNLNLKLEGKELHESELNKIVRGQLSVIDNLQAHITQGMKRT